MRFELRTAPGGAVRVIPLIESYPISRIEGRNGAGKTMAVRLLQMCCGDRPYSSGEQRSWMELKERLGEVVVTCTDLEGANRIVWTIDPTLWPDSPSDTFAIVAEAGQEQPAICSSVAVDDRTADDELIRSLVRVDRLVGDETLIESLTGEVASLRDEVARQRRSLDTAADSVREHLADLERLAEVLRSDELTRQRQLVETATADLGTAIERVTEAERRRDDVREWRLRQRQLDELEDDDQDPDELLRQLDREMTDAADAITQIRARQAALDLQAETDAKALADIQAVEAKIAEHREQRQDAFDIFTRTVASIGLAGTSPDDDSGLIRTATAETEDRLVELRAIQARIDASPQVVELGDAVLRVADERRFRPISDIPLAETSDGAAITPAELADAIERRRETMRADEQPPQAERIQAALEETTRRLRALVEAAGAMRRYRRRSTELRKSRERLAELTGQLSGVEGQEFAKLEEQATVFSEEYDALKVRRDELLTRIGQLGGGMSVATLRTRLLREMRTGGIAPDKLDEALEAATVALQERHTERAASQEALNRADAELQSLMAERKQAVNRLVTKSSWWGRLSLVLDADTAADESRLDGFAQSMLAAVGTVVDQFDDLDAALDSVQAGLVAAHDGQKPTSPPAIAVLRLVETRLGRAYFEQETVAEALFGGGSLDRLDLTDRRIEWIGADGSHISRPLEAFSSGERAFAYTRARLQRLRLGPAVRNRLVVLDEFGAFLERSRLDLLERYLHEEVVGFLADQALIILPLPEGPEALNGLERERRYRIVPLDHVR